MNCTVNIVVAGYYCLLRLIIMAILTIRDALNQALREEILRDENVFIMGEEVAEYDGAYKVTRGLWKEFGDKRVVDTPITELGFAAIGVGAAMAGLRPVIEFMTFNFSILAADQIINHAAKMLYMSGGQFKVPVVFRGPTARHIRFRRSTRRRSRLLCEFSRPKVVMPSTAADAKGLLKSSIRDDNPVIFMEQERMYGLKSEVPEDEDFTIPLGVADVKREGNDCTIVARSMTVPLALQAAEQIQKEFDVSVEVVDPRTIKPLDIDTIIKLGQENQSTRHRRRVALRLPASAPRSPIRSWITHLIISTLRSSEFRPRRLRCHMRKISRPLLFRMSRRSSRR